MKLTVEINAKSKKEIIKHILTVIKLLLDDQDSQSTAAYEYNLEDEDTNLYQIWMFPNKTNVKPRWDAKKFPQEPVEGKLKPLVTRFDNDHSDSLKIHQDAVIYAGRVNKGKSVKQTIDRDQAYVLCSQRRIKINDIEIKKGDGAEITDLKDVKITSLEDSEILFIDLPR